MFKLWINEVSNEIGRGFIWITEFVSIDFYGFITDYFI